MYADKAYISRLLKEALGSQDVSLLTPPKKEKGQLFMFEQLLSTSASRVRQSIESFGAFL